MKKEAKSEALIAAEKAEAEALRARILAATNTIPAKVRNDSSYQAAVNFKTLAVSARKATESRQPTLAKLRTAWQQISVYYA